MTIVMTMVTYLSSLSTPPRRMLNRPNQLRYLIDDLRLQLEITNLWNWKTRQQ